MRNIELRPLSCLYYRARWFDPTAGVFISEDPIGFAAGDTNLSRYVGNGTPNATDPSGNEEFPLYSSDGATYTTRIEATGLSQTDISAATKNIKKINPGFKYKGIPAIWHHKSFDRKTGEFVMELVEEAAHKAAHSGGFAQYLDWVGDIIQQNKLNNLSDSQATAVLKTLKDKKLQIRVLGRLQDKAIDVICKKLRKGGHRVIIAESGEVLVELAAKKVGRSLVGTVVKTSATGLPIVFVLYASGSAYAETGSSYAACDAAAREIVAADLVEGGVKVVVVGGGEVLMGSVVNFDGYVKKKFRYLPDGPRKDALIRDLILSSSRTESSTKAMSEISAEWREQLKREGKSWYQGAWDASIGGAIEWLKDE